MRMRKLMILVWSVALLSIAGCGAGDSALNSQAASDAPPAQDLQNVISATGEVRPARSAVLSFPVGGMVEVVHVEEGQEVQAGQVLLELKAVQLTRAVAEAEAALSAAKADLARVEAGAHPQDIIVAEQAVAVAGANVEVTQAQVAAARAGLGGARAGVSIAAAQVAIAEAGVKIAQAELRRAQAEYDRIGGASNAPQALALEQATLDLERIQAEYDRLAAGPQPSDLAPLRANVEAAQAQVTLAEAQVSQVESQALQAEVAVAQAQAALEAAQAQAAQAQAALDRLRAGPTTEEVAVAEAAVGRAQEAAVTARAMLDQATLAAPFDSTVGLIYLQQGEEAMPGQPALVLGDLATLRVGTTDLDEIDIARIHTGQRADLTFDALPDRVLIGRVVHIAPMSTPGQAATSYAVIIEFEEVDPVLRWGMTAFVDIRVE
jgi:HlyD family secretion protein